jgi:hypothetical protein
MRFYQFFLGFFLLSCAKSVVPSKVIDKSTYVDKFPAIKPSLTTVDFALSYDSLFALSQLKTGSVLFQNTEASTVLDFPLDIRLLGPIKAQSVARDNIIISLPVRMQAKPALAGISAGTVTGDLALQIRLKWDLVGLQTMQIREADYDYSWLQKPSVKVLGFPVNVSGVVDQLFNQKKPLILSQMQQSLNASIKNTVSKPLLFQRFFSDVPAGYQIEPVPSSAIDVRNLEFTSVGVKGQVRYFGGLRIKSGVQVQSPLLIPMKNLPSAVATSVLPFQYQLTGPEIVAFLKQSNPMLKGEANLVLGSSGMIFKLVKFKGKSSQIEANFDFVLYPDHSLGIQINDSRLSGLGFPASLFTRKIQRKLQVQAVNFRFQPSQLLKRLPSSISLQKGGTLRFHKVYYDSSSVLIEGALEGNWSLVK